MADKITTLDLRSMLRQFGVVTVMDVDVYKAERYTKDGVNGQEAGEWDSVKTFSGAKLFSLKTLKIANINTEGPTKTATGGQNADVLLKYGKTFTIEMQDALGSYDVLEHIYGANSNATETVGASIVSITDRFPGELTLVGKTFVVDKKTGAKQPIQIVIPFYLGDGIFNLTQDAEGDISVFDMNGNILRFSNGGINASEIENEDSDIYGKLYSKGADNEFYFFATKEAVESLKSQSYIEVWTGEKQYKVTKGKETTVLASAVAATAITKTTNEKVWYYSTASKDYVDIEALRSVESFTIEQLKGIKNGTEPVYEFIVSENKPTKTE